MPPSLRSGRCDSSDVAEADAPRRRPVERAEHLQQRRLAAAGRPLDRDELARRDREGHVGERGDRALRLGVGLRDVLERVHGGPSVGVRYGRT